MVKTLKFDHELAQLILSGQKTSTWRLYDDKDLSVGDDIKIIDKAGKDDPESWKVIGQAKVVQVTEKLLGDVTAEDMAGHEAFANREDMLATYKGYYGDRVTFETPVKIVIFEFHPSAGDTATPAMLLEEAKLFTDGGSRGNPGDSACAYVICNIAL